MAQERIFLGVDGGASKTHALVIAEDGTVRGFGAGGTGNHQSKGLEPALREIEKAVRGALTSANVSPEQVELGAFCLAGADLPDDYAMLQEAIDPLGLCRKVVIKNDTMAALRSGLSRPWGVAVICGTGFNAGGRAPDGREIQLPGLGPISGDWGGGGTLSIEMIRAVMRAWDGRGPSTLLTRFVLEGLGFPTEEALISALYHDQVPEKAVLHLTPRLFDAALEGDPVACDLVERMGAEVGVTANALIRRLGLAETGVEVVLGGSVFKGRGPLLIDTARRVVHEVAPAARLVRPRLEPVGGAALLALDFAGVPTPVEVNQRLESFKF